MLFSSPTKYKPSCRGVPFGLGVVVDPWCCTLSLYENTKQPLNYFRSNYDPLITIFYLNVTVVTDTFCYFAAFTVITDLAYRWSEIVDFCTNRKRVYDFLSSIVTLLVHRLSCRVSEILEVLYPPPSKATFRYPSRIPVKISGCSFVDRRWSCWGLPRANIPS